MLNQNQGNLWKGRLWGLKMEQGRSCWGPLVHLSSSKAEHICLCRTVNWLKADKPSAHELLINLYTLTFNEGM